jgi:peptide deformylase
MTIELTLIDDSDPILHTKAIVFNPREWLELDDTIKAMIVLMRQKNGMGLAAPQVGISKRLFVMADGSQEYVIVNPKIKRTKKKTKIDSEGCLSYPERQVLVERSTEIRVSYQTSKGGRVERTFRDHLARCFLHEFDHLNGITFLDIGTPV